MNSPKEAYAQYLMDNGIRRSPQRENILDIFLKTDKHLTIAEIYDLVRKKYPCYGFATVYRAIKVIAAAGLAKKIDFGDGIVRFENNFGNKHHDHLICTKCGKIVEAFKPEIEDLQVKFAEEYNFKITNHRLQIFGLCKKCQKKKG